VADDHGFSYIEQIPSARFENTSFVPVEESKWTKNRVHIDVVTDNVAAIVNAAATLLRPHDDEIDWDVLAWLTAATAPERAS
jgi:hypothetical protein